METQTEKLQEINKELKNLDNKVRKMNKISKMKNILEGVSGGEHSNWFIATKVETVLQTQAVLPPCTPQPKSFTGMASAGNLGFRNQTQGENWVWKYGKKWFGVTESA